ncbi:MAG: hypothetical protein GYA36_19495 [Veillonellaceae bacterium]|nr:hypothetical protein [Veillonellaceae bacterium]
MTPSHGRDRVRRDRVRELRLQAEKAEKVGFIVRALRLTAEADAMEERLRLEPDLPSTSDGCGCGRDRW